MDVIVNSKLHMCFHEAGHVEAAYLWGATVCYVEIDRSGQPRTSITHKEDLSTKKPVACGGYAAENLLFTADRLVDQCGIPLSHHVFKVQAMQNARFDKFPFYITQNFDRESGVYPGSPYQPSDGVWPEESDDPFILYAETEIVPELRVRFETIKKLAMKLSRCGYLDQYQIENLRTEQK